MMLVSSFCQCMPFLPPLSSSYVSLTHTHTNTRTHTLLSSSFQMRNSQKRGLATKGIKAQGSFTNYSLTLARGVFIGLCGVKTGINSYSRVQGGKNKGHRRRGKESEKAENIKTKSIMKMRYDGQMGEEQQRGIRQ